MLRMVGFLRDIERFFYVRPGYNALSLVSVGPEHRTHRLNSTLVED